MTITPTENNIDEDHFYPLNTLLKMHEFYGNEARHQRAMMWDTVKWFTPILMAIHSGWFLLYRNKPADYDWLIILSISGILFVLICLFLLRTFYRTNLIYVSMFVKIEDELNLLKRKRQYFFSEDDKITYNKYLDDRLEHKTAESFVETNLRQGTMHRSMRYVFFLFLAGFLFEFYLVLWKIIGSSRMETWSQVFAIIFGLVGAYFLAFSLRIKTQYSEDLIKELNLSEKGFVIPTEVSQKKRMFWWGFGLITVAAIIQIFLIISRSVI
jgi:uncharacterized membrane protein YuzA (DUF378 family)